MARAAVLAERNSALPAGSAQVFGDLSRSALAYSTLWSEAGMSRSAENQYPTMTQAEIEACPSRTSRPKIARCFCGRSCRNCRKRWRSSERGGSNIKLAPSFV